MGYIEPRSSIQYQHYADRVRRNDPRYRILPINRIAPYNCFTGAQKVCFDNRKEDKKKLSDKIQPSDHFRYTGKGLYINDLI